MIPLTLKREEGKVLIKKGRKKFCSISYNKNTDYKFMIWFDGMPYQVTKRKRQQ